MSGISSIILNENNLLPLFNTFSTETNTAPFNKFYQEISNGANLKDHEICLNKLTMYYSWPNITSSNYQAATIQWDVLGVYSSFSWNLTQNYNYGSIQELNDALQQFCITNGLYLINGTSNVYYMTFVANPNSYGVDLTLFKVPTSLPAGYTAPSNFIGYPSVSKTMRITFNSSFNKIVGFASSTLFDGSTTQTTYTSSFCPQLSPVSSILVSCNLANNPLALNGSSNIMTSFNTKDTAYGATISVEPNTLTWFDINGSLASSLVVSLLDSNFNDLNVRDPQTTIQLLIRPKQRNTI